MTKAKTTGRGWKCPKCGTITWEAGIKHTSVTCNRELKCRHGGGQKCVLIPAPKEPA